MTFLAKFVFVTEEEDEAGEEGPEMTEVHRVDELRGWVAVGAELVGDTCQKQPRDIT